MKALRFSPTVWMGLLCGLGAAGIGIFLLVARKPWDVDIAPGRALRIRDFVVIYEWWAAAINLVIIVLLGLSARWWLSPARQPAVSWLPKEERPGGSGHWSSWQ